jgi:hypothetical protein
VSCYSEGQLGKQRYRTLQHDAKLKIDMDIINLECAIKEKEGFLVDEFDSEDEVELEEHNALRYTIESLRTELNRLLACD